MNLKRSGGLGLAVVAALSGACGGGGGGSSGGGGAAATTVVTLPGSGLLWMNQQRVPSSSHLRAVRFANTSQGLIAGEATNFLRTDNGGSIWAQQEHLPKDRGGDVAGMDVDGTRVRAVGSDAGGGKVWDSPDTLTWSTANAAGSGAAYVAVDVERAFSGPPNAISFRLRANGDVDVTDAPEGVAAVTVPSGIGGAALCIEVVGAGLAFWYVGGANSGGTLGEIRRSQNSGSTFGTETLPGGSGIIRDFYFSDGDQGVACGDNSTVIRRDGTGWSDISGDLPAGLTLRGIFFPNSQVGWVVGNGGNVWRTSNGGTNWVQQAIGLTTEDLYDVWFPASTLGYAVGNNGMVLKCTSGGNWKVITEGDLVQFNAVDFTSDGQRGIAVGNDLGGQPSVYRTLDGGAHWTLFNGGIPPGTTDFYGVSIPRAGNGNVAYVCGAGGTIYRNTSIGGGGTWVAMNSFAGANALRAILFPDDNDNGVCVGDGDTIVHTLNGTGTLDWTIAALVPSTDYKCLSFARDGSGIRIYAAGTAGVVAQATTFPSPTNWTALAAPAATTVQALSSVAGSPDVLFAAGSNGTLYRLAIGGSWTTPAVPAGSTAANGLAFTDANNGWWVSNQIYTTVNGGTSWQISPDHAKSVFRAVWVDSTGLISYAAGDNGAILKSTTGGK